MASLEIHAAKTVSGNQPQVQRIIEDAGETFLAGTPVQIDASSGGVKEWAGTVGTDLIAGFCVEPASNLATTGAGAPSGLSPVLGIGSGTTFGSVPYQASAHNIPRGAPMSDGRIGLEIAVQDTIFYGQVGPAQTTVLGDVGVAYGITKDSDGHWYVDRTKTGANAVVVVTGLDPIDGPKLAGRVFFRVQQADSQFAT